ncbi:MAG: diguanylate cyclase, partial [Alphaproteobacteria bacterium]
AMVCRETLRDPDILGRYSDSVLAFILPESADAAGVQLAARLIEGVSDIRLPSAKGALTFTVSAGVAASVGTVADIAEIFNQAERQLAAAHGVGVEQVKGCFVGERREHLDEALARLGRRESDRQSEEFTAVELTSEELEMLLNRKPN